MKEWKPSEIANLIVTLRKEALFQSCRFSRDILANELKEAASALEELSCRAEPENKALTVEQLRKMDEEPVWIRDLLIPTCSTWHWICEDPVHGLVAVKPLNVDGYYDIEHGHNYGQTWFAYARKPEGSETP